MNVLTLIPHEMAQSDPYWVGTLSMAAACALSAVTPIEARRILKRSLDDFLRSPACDPELHRMLFEEMKR